MKLGIIGLPQSGKLTIFNALTGARGLDESPKDSRMDQRIGTVRVADERVDFLTELYQPKKTTYARVEYLLPAKSSIGSASGSQDVIWNQARTGDALIHVTRNFRDMSGTAATPEKDFSRLDEEMILADLLTVEKRLERLELDKKRGQKPSEEELRLLQDCRRLLTDNQPLRINGELSSAPLLRGFTFLSAKAQLVIINNEDEDEALPEWKIKPEKVVLLPVRGRLEMEITALSPEEAREFQEAYHIEESALDQVIKISNKLLGLLSFFTVLNHEVRAWTIKRGTPALEAAGSVHSDIQRGFIRAEVISFGHLQEYGSFQEAKKAGQVRLEGKEYIVQDGDIINFRFNI
ncbi:DUF933 domain-containing protein [Thermodesulfobacteriota bacterium]